MCSHMIQQIFPLSNTFIHKMFFFFKIYLNSFFLHYPYNRRNVRLRHAHRPLGHVGLVGPLFDNMWPWSSEENTRMFSGWHVYMGTLLQTSVWDKISYTCINYYIFCINDYNFNRYHNYIDVFWPLNYRWNLRLWHAHGPMGHMGQLGRLLNHVWPWTPDTLTRMFSGWHVYRG